jgi:hypothetical protein
MISSLGETAGVSINGLCPIGRTGSPADGPRPPWKTDKPSDLNAGGGVR